MTPGEPSARRNEQRRERDRDWWRRTGLTDASGSVVDETRNAKSNAADALHTVGDAATAPIKAVWHATPLSGLTSSQERQPAFNDSGNR